MFRATNYVTFFEKVFGFPETQYEETQKKLLEMSKVAKDSLDGALVHIFTLADGRRLQAGTFATPSIEEMVAETKTLCDAYYKRAGLRGASPRQRKITIRNDVDDVSYLHIQPENAGSVIQAASQFNCLEMVSPNVRPEQGISRYANDRTQGPACAIACAPGTAFRNYCVTGHSEEGIIGQRVDHQVECMADVGRYLQQQLGAPAAPFSIRNGYIDATEAQLAAISKLLSEQSHLAEVVKRLRIGVHRDTEVTHPDIKKPHFVTQTYNSACSVGYSRLPGCSWEPLARAVLIGSYRGTIHAGIHNNFRRLLLDQPADRPVHLTKVGGGVFANEAKWIIDAMNDAIEEAAAYPLPFDLDIRVVHYGGVESPYDRSGVLRGAAIAAPSNTATPLPETVPQPTSAAATQPKDNSEEAQ